MILFHTTGDIGIENILDSFVIKPSERDSFVWLSDRPDGWFRKEGNEFAEATTHCVTVDVPDGDVITAWRSHVPPAAAQGYERWSVFGNPDSWRVVTRPIPSSEWLRIVRIADDVVIWTP